jgi:hypothetical protein
VTKKIMRSLPKNFRRLYAGGDKYRC